MAEARVVPDSMIISPADAYLKSTYLEKLVEHVFISEILQEVWFSFGKTVEVLRSEVDASGYDVVFECEGILRHVQLKTSNANAKTSGQKVNSALEKKGGGCVVWIVWHKNADAQRIKLSYLFFGGDAGKQLPTLDAFKVAKHTKPNAQGIKTDRPAIRVVPKIKFERVETTSEPVQRLFGFPPAGQSG